MPSLPTDLATVSDFKLAQNVLGTNDDAWIQRLVTRASLWIEQATNRKLVARRYNGATGTAPNNVHPTTLVADEDYLYFDGDPLAFDLKTGLGVHYLPQYPIQANTVLPFQLSVLKSRDDIALTGDVWDATQLLEGRDYIVDRVLGAIKLLGGRFGLGVKAYRVQMAAGYQGTQQPWVPQDLQDLCIDLANLVYRDKRNLKSESLSYTYSREYDTSKSDPFVEAILGSYTRLPIY